MTLSPDIALFDGKAKLPLHPRERLFLLLGVLLVNAVWESLIPLGVLLGLGVLFSGIEKLSKNRWRIFALSFLGAGGIYFFAHRMGLLSDRWIILSLRFGVGLIWGLWFSSTLSWPQLKRVFHSLAIPPLLIELIDSSLFQAMLVVEEKNRQCKALYLRGANPYQLSHLTSLMGGIIVKSLSRGEMLSNFQLLRLDSEEINTVAEPLSGQSDIVQIKNGTLLGEDQAVLLSDLSFSLHRGEWILLAGRSGSGKSSLLGACAGINEWSRGEMIRFGKAVQGKEIRNRVDHRAGLLLQNPEDQFFCSTVLEDVAWGIRKEFDEAKRRELAQAILADLDLTHLSGRPIHRLSFGEKKRVALAGLVVRKPSLLLLDEPTLGLDPISAQDLISFIERCLEYSPASVIWATHDLPLIPGRMKRILFLDEKRIVFDGSLALFWKTQQGECWMKSNKMSLGALNHA
ncbi:MAG: ABC transporter ATP-binding protein [Proteobacteria bacterium]|nr:ABC transporter ATP-binding protein [Pseudomonadota bacterium]